MSLSKQLRFKPYLKCNVSLCVFVPNCVIVYIVSWVCEVSLTAVLACAYCVGESLGLFTSGSRSSTSSQAIGLPG